MRRGFLIVTLSLLAGLDASLPARPRQPHPSDQLVDVGGYRLRMRSAGSGVPSVVLDCGFGDRLEVWDEVFSQVARFARVVAYDRAGYGKSDPGPEPRSFTKIATELHTLLHNAGVAPPYVLVGHSMGGANIRAFAHLYQGEVAGLVYVDPLTENIFQSVSQKEKDAVIAQQAVGIETAPPGAQGEWRFLRKEGDAGFPELTSFGAPPDVPTMLLVAGRDRPPRWVKSVLELYGSWIAGATEGRMIVTADSTHYIHRDEPSLVVSAIRRVVFPSAENALGREIRQNGVDSAIALYRRLKQRYPADYFGERMLNRLGYQQLRAKHTPEAIKLFQLNVQEYPKAYNTYDSLAEAYLAQGDRRRAIENYRKSLKLNPESAHSARALKELEAGSEKKEATPPQGP